jgi:hypothetical protein
LARRVFDAQARLFITSRFAFRTPPQERLATAVK